MRREIWRGRDAQLGVYTVPDHQGGVRVEVESVGHVHVLTELQAAELADALQGALLESWRARAWRRLRAWWSKGSA